MMRPATLRLAAIVLCASPFACAHERPVAPASRAPAAAQAPLQAGALPPSGDALSPAAAALAASIDPRRLQQTVAKLVAFGTRHTLSETTSPTRGIGAARRWLAGEFLALTRLPGSRLQPFEDRFTAPPQPRIPSAVEVVDVGVVLPGADPARTGPGRRCAVVMTGHYDSRASDILDAQSDAPGANDDGSGVAMALELARAFATLDTPVSVYFVAVAGEEQGLVGSSHLAARLKAEGVEVLADVSVDIAGNSEGEGGVVVDNVARLYSEGVPQRETAPERKIRVALGGENDSPSRQWARYVQRVGERAVPGLDLQVMLRRDRIARGTDDMPFLAEGFPGIRLSEGREDFARQHQNPRVENGVAYGDDLAHYDAAYAAKLGRALGAALASLALAPAPPAAVALSGAVSTTAKLRWTLPADPRLAGVVVYRRRADAVAWQRADRLGKVDRLELPGVVGDDEYFAVATTDEAGNESLPQTPSRLE